MKTFVIVVLFFLLCTARLLGQHNPDAAPLNLQDLKMLLGQQDSLFQQHLHELELRVKQQQKDYLDSSLSNLRSHSDSSRIYQSLEELKVYIQGDSIATQRLLNAFLEKSKTDALFYKQITASGKVLTPTDSIFIIRLDSAVLINWKETNHIVRLLKNHSIFLDTYINLSLFTLGLIGGNLLNGHEHWGLYTAEIVGGLLAWKAISSKHKIDDWLAEMQKVNDDLDQVHKDIVNFKAKLVQYSYRYPDFLSEKIPLVNKKYELLSLNLSLDNILDQASLKRGSEKYNLLLRSNSWMGMSFKSVRYKLFSRRQPKA